MCQLPVISLLAASVCLTGCVYAEHFELEERSVAGQPSEASASSVAEGVQ